MKFSSLLFSSLLFLVVSSVSAQQSFTCFTDPGDGDNCAQQIDPNGNFQGCQVVCGPCTFFFHCSPQVGVNAFSDVIASGGIGGCSVYWECPGSATGDFDIRLFGVDEGINSGGLPTTPPPPNGTWYNSNYNTNMAPGFFNWVSPGVQQYVYIELTDPSGAVICETQYYYNCY